MPRKQLVPRHRREREELTGKAEDIATALRTAELPEELISNKGLAAVVRELPQRQREAVFLRFLVGLGTDSIALHMGIGGSWVATSDLQLSEWKSASRSTTVWRCPRASMTRRRPEPGARGRRLSGMRIGELSQRTGVSPRSLRYYEEQGLLTSSRSGAGQRHYSDAAVQRVSLIRQLFDAGMSSRVIATVLPCVDVPGDLGVAEETFTAMTRERDRIDADIAHLIETRDALDVLIRANSRHRAELSTAPEPVAQSA